MAARRADGISSRSLMRTLAGARSFARFLERNGKGKVGALAAVRAPKVAKTLPKPLAIDAAKRITETDLRAGEEREPWILARDAAVLALALRLRACASPRRSASSARIFRTGPSESITVTGKGDKTRMVPVLAAGRRPGRRLCRALPVRTVRRRAAVRRRQGRPALAARRPARHGAAARRARTAGDRDPACAAAFLRHPPAGARRRFARDPGAARPRLAVDHADLHRGRYRTAARRSTAAPIRGLDSSPVHRNGDRTSCESGRPFDASSASRNPRRADHEPWRARGPTRGRAPDRARERSAARPRQGNRRRQKQEDRAADRGDRAVPGVFRDARQERADQRHSATTSRRPTCGISSRPRRSAGRGGDRRPGDEGRSRPATSSTPRARRWQEQIDTWQKTAHATSRAGAGTTKARGSVELMARAKAAESKRDHRAGELSSLRGRVGGLPDRHRAGVRGRHHRNDRAGLCGGRARAVGIAFTLHRFFRAARACTCSDLGHERRSSHAPIPAACRGCERGGHCRHLVDRSEAFHCTGTSVQYARQGWFREGASRGRCHAPVKYFVTVGTVLTVGLFAISAYLEPSSSGRRRQSVGRAHHRDLLTRSGRPLA